MNNLFSDLERMVYEDMEKEGLVDSDGLYTDRDLRYLYTEYWERLLGNEDHLYV